MNSGIKYHRTINSIPEGENVSSIRVDVYSVLVAFDVKCPATQHAIKKLLCAGHRGKCSRVQDLEESLDAIKRAIEIQKCKLSGDE